MEKKLKNTKKSNRTTPLYKDITDHTNKLLKTSSLQCDIGNGLSTYWARHTWASVANLLEIPKTVVSLALGHSSDSVTDVYINTDIERVDEANQKVIKYLHKTLYNSENNAILRIA